MNRLSIAIAVVLLFLACDRDLSIPEPPPVKHQPVITSFAPQAAFSNDAITVFGENFDAKGNQLTFPGGSTALAELGPDGGDLRLDGGLVFIVPEGLQLTAPLVLDNTQGRSAVSADDFVPLGVGHPNYGTPVAQLRFRHDPVGIVDTPDNVLMASSIFDLVVTDGKAFRRVPGRPLAMVRSPTPDRGLLTVRTPTGGMMLEVALSDGEVIRQSGESDVRDGFILPPADDQTLARTLGADTKGQVWLSEWSLDGGALVPTRRSMPFAQVFGAAARGPSVVVAARGSAVTDTVANVYDVSSGAATQLWAPSIAATCSVNDAECAPPDGPIALVPGADGGMNVAFAVTTGDLIVVNQQTSAATPLTTVSYARIAAVRAGTAPDRLLLTKPLDGALFQYDVATGDLDWAVQLRGEPTLIDVDSSIDEVAVGNRSDNTVDTVTESTGQWTGRIAFDLGLGTADGAPGGIVAPYSYDPSRYPQGATIVQRMDVLMRNVGLVVSVDASSLEVFDHVVLDPAASAPLRLAVSADLETLVIHERQIGVLRDGAAGREEQIVTMNPFTEAPLDVAVLPTGEVALSHYGTVDLYRFGANGRLGRVSSLPMPAGATWQATAAANGGVVVLWHSVNGYAGGFYPLTQFTTNPQPTFALDLDPQDTEFVGAVTLREGPALVFGRSTLGGPVAYPFDALVDRSLKHASVISRPTISIAAPDGHFVLWLDQGAEEPVARLVNATAGADWWSYSSYRLPGAAAGPAFDPSGQWLYIPIPRTDEVDVVQ